MIELDDDEFGRRCVLKLASAAEVDALSAAQLEVERRAYRRLEAVRARIEEAPVAAIPSDDDEEARTRADESAERHSKTTAAQQRPRWRRLFAVRAVRASSRRARIDDENTTTGGAIAGPEHGQRKPWSPDDEAAMALSVVWARRGGLGSVLRCFDMERPHSLVLERAFMRMRVRLFKLRESVGVSWPDAELVHRWATQATLGFAFLHSCGIVQVDGMLDLLFFRLHATLAFQVRGIRSCSL